MLKHLTTDAPSARVRAFSRLHFGLVNLSNCGSRINGGCGAMLAEPYLEVVAKKSSNFCITPSSFHEEVTFVSERLGIRQPLHISITVDQRFKWHIGLGFHTQLRLAIGTAILFALDIDFDPSMLASRLSRGGTSGIGSHGFWHGGIIFDSGQPRTSEHLAFTPSAYSQLQDISPLLYHHSSCQFIPVIAMPRDWHIVHGEMERHLFTQLTPIPENEAAECARVVFADLRASVTSCNYSAFCSAITSLSSLGFKKREIEYRGLPALTIISSLMEAGLDGVSMSSWGPVCFGFAKDITDANQALQQLKRCVHLEDAWITSFATGATVSIDNGADVLALQLATHRATL